MNVAVEQYEGTRFQQDWELLEVVLDLTEAKGPGSKFDCHISKRIKDTFLVEISSTGSFSDSDVGDLKL